MLDLKMARAQWLFALRGDDGDAYIDARLHYMGAVRRAELFLAKCALARRARR